MALNLHTADVFVKAPRSCKRVSGVYPDCGPMHDGKGFRISSNRKWRELLLLSICFSDRTSLETVCDSYWCFNKQRS